MRYIVILSSLAIIIATSAYAYTTGDWRCISGACTLGASSATSVTVITDGGSIVMDGSITASHVVTSGTATIVANTVHLASVAQDYNLPECSTATIGDWVTVIVRDVSEVVSLVPASGDTIHAPGTTTVLGIDDELDSAGGADDDGDFISLNCAQDNHWYATSIGCVWVDGGTS